MEGSSLTEHQEDLGPTAVTADLGPTAVTADLGPTAVTEDLGFAADLGPTAVAAIRQEKDQAQGYQHPLESWPLIRELDCL